MRRSKNQIIYSALPGQFITFSSNRSDKENCKRANQCVINVRKWNTKRIEKNEKVTNECFGSKQETGRVTTFISCP